MNPIVTASNYLYYELLQILESIDIDTYTRVLANNMLIRAAHDRGPKILPSPASGTPVLIIPAVLSGFRKTAHIIYEPLPEEIEKAFQKWKNR